MPLWNCELCNYSTKFKADFTKHTKTKKHRNKIIPQQDDLKETDHKSQNEPIKSQNEPVKSQNEPVKCAKKSQNEPMSKKSIYKCNFCNSVFKSHASKRRHENYRCKENPNIIDVIIDAKNSKIKKLEKDNELLEKDKEHWEKEKEKLEKEKDKLYGQVASLLDKVGDTNIQNNIILNNYGNEDLSHITNTLKNELLKVPYGAIPKMIEAIHFNDEKPENKNILIPNKKENLVKVFQGDRWVYKNKNETITDLVDSKYNIIDDHYEEMSIGNQIPIQIQSSFKKFKKYYESEDVEMIENLRKECELVLLNNR